MPKVILATAESFGEGFFSHHDTAFFACLFGMVVLVVAVPVITAAWGRVVKHRAHADLKRSMIERVLRAKTSDE